MEVRLCNPGRSGGGSLEEEKKQQKNKRTKMRHFSTNVFIENYNRNKLIKFTELKK